MIYNNIADLIGNTPMVRLNKINETNANIVLKLEYYNPSCSIKDRAAYYMLKEAQKEGKINGDTIIIEPTSGNTGIGLAMCCAVLNLRLIIVMPENMSEERKKIIQGYGATLVLTSKEKGMQGAVDKALKLAERIPESFVPMQFSNPTNVLAHEETTAQEIYTQTDGKVDIVVAGIGTGGTVSGISRGLKKYNDKIKVIGVEPYESPLITKGTVGEHKIQGIGANFIPENYHSDAIDEVLAVKSDEAIQCARTLAKKEGILCGISSGANVLAALEIAKRNENNGKLIVTIISDFAERYLSTELF